MSYEAHHNAIRTRFEGLWDDVTYPVSWPNAEFDQRTLDTLTQWIRFRIDDAAANWASMGDPGNNVNRNLGQVTMSAFVKKGQGDAPALRMVDAAKAIFLSWEDPTTCVKFRVPPYARQVPGTEDSKWYQVNIIAPFERDVLE